MRRDESIERIKSCMAMESVCSGVYHLLSLNFQEEKDLWNKLALDDETHAGMIASLVEFKAEDLSAYPVPEELGDIRNTISYAHETRKLLVNDKLPLRKALERMENLHDLKKRSYLNDLLGKEKDEKIKQFFEKLFEIDASNMEMIRTFINNYHAQGGR